MAENKLNILIVEDDPQLLRILQAVLKQEIELRIANTGRLALQMIEDQPPSIVLLDMRLPDMMGMDILKEIARKAIPTTVIVMTAHGSVDLAVDAMREGAYDFMTKPLDFERVRVMVRNAVERHRIIQELDSYKTQYERTRFRGLMGSSPAMQRLYRQLRSVGLGSSPALLVGEPGTELSACARALHDESARASAPFGECAGSTLGPDALAIALTEYDRGTLSISAVEDMPRDGREALLAYLQKGRIGDHAWSTRVIASSHAALNELALQGRFEKDLLVALEVARIQVSPLRERGEDVLDMAEHLLGAYTRELERSFTGFSDEVEVALVHYEWPGNRGELEKVLRAAIQKHEGRTLTLEMLPAEISATLAKGDAKGAAPVRGLAGGSIRPLWQVEREEIEKALKLCEGNVLQAARLLEVSPGTIYRKQQSWKSRKL